MQVIIYGHRIAAIADAVWLYIKLHFFSTFQAEVIGAVANIHCQMFLSDIDDKMLTSS